jgi:hypothetical protein
MPTAPEEQVPKPLTYTLMYHALWCVMFVLSACALAVLFLATGWGFPRAVLAPLTLLALGVAAGIGAFVAYGIRLSVLLGDATKEEAFQWSALSSRAVLVLAPLLWAAWFFAEPSAQAAWNGGRDWAPPEGISSLTFKVEVIVWWLSHLLSVRGLARGRRKYLAGDQSVSGTELSPASHAAPVLTSAEARS